MSGLTFLTLVSVPALAIVAILLAWGACVRLAKNGDKKKTEDKKEEGK